MFAPLKSRLKAALMTCRRGALGGIAIAIATAATSYARSSSAEDAAPRGLGPPQSAAPALAPPEKKWPITLDLGAFVGASVRLGSAPSLRITDRSGLLAGAGLVLAPSRLFSIGLAYEHLNLGDERLGQSDIGSASVERDAHALFMDLRVYPYRGEAASVFAGLGVGLAWQGAEATRVEEALTESGASVGANIVLCSVRESASVALRGGAGVEVPFGAGLVFVSDVSFENARLSGELLDRCISGAGTTALFAFRVGLAYRLDMTRLFR
jgi:hypothetical protein